MRYQVICHDTGKILLDTKFRDFAESEKLDYGKYGSRSAFIKEYEVFKSDLKNELEKFFERKD